MSQKRITINLKGLKRDKKYSCNKLNNSKYRTKYHSCFLFIKTLPESRQAYNFWAPDL